MAMVVAKNMEHPLANLSSEQLTESTIHTLANVLAAIARRKFLDTSSAGIDCYAQTDRQVA
ncbi:MAG: hypothetical protein QM811_13585 [Pirellulales bacterium]